MDRAVQDHLEILGRTYLRKGMRKPVMALREKRLGRA